MYDAKGIISDAALEQLEDLAFHGGELPKGLRFPEQMLFLRFRHLYAYARMIHMDPAQGKREKEQIVAEYSAHLASHILYLGCNDRYIATEAAAAEIRKDARLYNEPKVRALMEAIYGKADRRLPDERSD